MTESEILVDYILSSGIVMFVIAWLAIIMITDLK